MKEEIDPSHGYETVDKMNEANLKKLLIAVAFVLFSVVVIGLGWLAGGDHPVSLTLSYAAGLSMIFLPCTLPLVFVIVPLSMGKGYKKGFLMALLFGLGVTLTLTIYGLITAFVGSYFGLDNFSRGMFFFAGVIAFVFGLSQLKLLNVTLPEIPIPGLQGQRDYTKAFLMGVLLGNAGVGCPNPAFYVLLAYIATKASLVSGAWLGFLHGLGRATPLIFISILAIIGVNATKWVARKREKIDTFMGWGLLIVGVFILSIGLFGMYWWEESFLHKAWNAFVAENIPRLAETVEAAEFFGIEVNPSPVERYWPWAPWLFMAVMLAIPLVWKRCKK